MDKSLCTAATLVCGSAPNEVCLLQVLESVAMTLPEIGRALTGEEIERETNGRIKKKTLDHWRMQGKGPPYFKVGRRVLYRRADVERWLADQGRRA